MTPRARPCVIRWCFDAASGELSFCACALAVSGPLPGLQETGGVSGAMTLGDAFGQAEREIWISPVYLGRLRE